MQLIHEFFRASVLRAPQAIAIDIPPGRGRAARITPTYGELGAAVTELAAVLRPLRGAGDVYAIDLPRETPALYIAQLAVLEAGGAFTCLDPAFPAERKGGILEDSGAVALLEPDPSAPHGIGIRVLRKGAPGAAIADPTPASLAYLIYTSGTTGRPKGVMIEHRSLANLIASDLEYFGLGPQDRVVQGSSAAYDSSLEEIWLAFAAGATLLVMDDAAARLGPDLVAWLRAERASVFCPPPTLLRATGCADPAAALPDLRLLYVGGEALGDDLAARWSAGRRMVNGYGPTECTVTCLRAEIVGGQPVAIGAPVSGASAWVLGDDGDEVAHGERGELCIGGIGLARGYCDAPELTAAKFSVHPTLGRIYRSGDLVHRDATGQFFYHGRIDSQIKLRGYRIELGEIETALADCDGVRAAACTVQTSRGGQSLVGFVVAHDPAHPPAAEALKAALGAALPAYMVPRAIEVIAALPTTVGGKLDRAALPRVAFAEQVAKGDAGVRPRDAVEARLEAAVADILHRSEGVSVEADFFAVGGDSLSAALLVTLLREDPATEWVSVADIYEARTIAALAKRGRGASAPAKAEGERPAPLPGQYPLAVTAAQIGWLLLVLIAAGAGAWALGFVLFPWLLGSLSLTGFILLAPLIGAAGFAVYTPCAALLAIAAKRLLIGRYRALRTPVWSGYYLRHWIVQTLVRLIPWRALEGTPAQQAILRGLGARIGARVHLHRGVDLRRGGWDLLTIGDDVSVGQEAMLRLTELDRGELVVGAITLGDGATVETRAGLAGNTAIGAGGCLTALSALEPGASVGAGERWSGVPAHSDGIAPPVPALTAEAATLSPALHGQATVLAEGLVLALAALPAELATLLACRLAGIDAEVLWRWMYHPTFSARLWALLIATTVLSVPLTLVWSANLARLLGRVRPGVISRWSPGYIRVWLKTALLIHASEWLSGTLFWPWWLRRAGMKIGAGSEISTILDVVPELVAIGGDTFFADGIYLGGARHQHGTVSLAPTSLGRNTFLGNHVVIAAGQQLPDDILIGVSTPADAERITRGTSWFGHPSFELPRREVVEADRSVTHEPSLARYCSRVFWEGLRFALPLGPLMVSIGWFAAAGAAAARDGLGVRLFLLDLPLVTLGAVLAAWLAVFALKWGLLGRVRPGQHPLWSCWCSRWDFLYVAWGKWARASLELLEGTLLLNLYLRGIGMKIGKRVVLGPGFAQVVDPDMLTLEDDSTVNANFQAHTFEDRVLKIDHVRVGRGATLGAATVPLYGADIGAFAWVGPHSVVMKREHLMPQRHYHGAPVKT